MSPSPPRASKFDSPEAFRALLAGYSATRTTCDRMASEPWYKRIVSLRATWDRIKAFGREFDSYGAEDEAWHYQTRVEQRRIAWDGLTGKIDFETSQRLIREAHERQRNVWRAFRPDEPDAE